MSQEHRRALRRIEIAIDAALAAERSRRARTEPDYKRMWLEVRMLCDCGDGYFRRLTNRHDCRRFFGCTNPHCDRRLSSADYNQGKGEVCAALVDGYEPQYAFERVAYRRKR